MEDDSNPRELQVLNPQRQDAIYHSLGLTNIDPPITAFHESPQRFSQATRQAYAFTTENMAEYIGDLDFAGKRVACIGGSADFAFNAFLHGARAVDAVDISPVACLLGELKAAGLQQLKYGEFLNFFATAEAATFGPQSYSYEHYQRLRPHISGEAQHFFDQLITSDVRSDFLSPNGMIIDKLRDMNIIRGMDPYIRTPEEYEAAKKSQKQVTFYPQDIQAFLDEHRGSGYGVIHLSNIFAYPPYSEHGGDKAIDRTIQVSKDALMVGGEVLNYNFIKKDEDTWGLDLVQRRWEKKGMSGRRIVGSVPHNSNYEFVALALQRKPDKSISERLGTLLRNW
jgi:hypothetical protein